MKVLRKRKMNYELGAWSNTPRVVPLKTFEALRAKKGGTTGDLVLYRMRRPFLLPIN